MEQQQAQVVVQAQTLAERTIGTLDTLSDSVNKSLAKSINVFSAAVTKQYEELETLKSELSELVYRGQVQAQKNDELKALYDTSVREHEADLRIRQRENEDVLLEQLMRSRNLADITRPALTELYSQLEEAKQDNAEAIQKAVNSAVTSLKQRHEADVEIAEAEHSAAMARQGHENVALKHQIEAMKAEVQRANSALEKEREARIEIAKASGQNHVTINGASK